MEIKSIKNYNFLFVEKYNFIYLFLFFSIFLISNGGTNIFNGLPWVNKYEVFTILIFIPLVFFLNYKILFKPTFKVLIVIIFFLKLVLIFSPTVGIGHKVNYESAPNITKSIDVNGYNYIKTYSSFWNQKYSDIQEFDWNNKENFPLDSVNYDRNVFNTFGSIAPENEGYVNLNFRTKFNFFLNVKKKSKFRILSQGSKNGFNIFIKNVANKEKSSFIFNKDLEIFYLNKYLNAGIYHISGEILFNKKNWNFIPQLSVDEGEYKSAIKEKIVFLDLEKKIPLLSTVSLVGSIYDSLVFLFFFSILIYMIFANSEKYIGYKEILSSVGFFIILIVNQYFLSIIISNYHNFWPFALTLIIFIFLITLDNFFKKNTLFDNLYNFPVRYLFIILGPSFFFLATTSYYSDLEKTSFWSYGDDWHVFQEFARIIVIDGDWLGGGEKISWFRPGSRYLYAILHILFGQSSFSIKFLELWAILGSSMLILSFLRKINVSTYLASTAAIILIIFFFGENFRYLVGRGLSSYYAMFFLFVSSYLFLNINMKNYFLIFLLAVIATFAAWFREEKLLVALVLIFLANNINQKNITNFWHYLFVFFKKNYKQIIFYWFLVMVGFPFIYEMRNYYLGGEFMLISHPAISVKHLAEPIGRKDLNSFYEILTATQYGQIPRLTPIFLLPAFIISIIILIFPKIFRLLPYPGLYLIILTTVFPTLIVWMGAYVPRHSIFLLPYGIILSFLFFENIFYKKFRNISLREKL